MSQTSKVKIQECDITINISDLRTSAHDSNYLSIVIQPRDFGQIQCIK